MVRKSRVLWLVGLAILVGLLVIPGSVTAIQEEADPPDTVTSAAGGEVDSTSPALEREVDTLVALLGCVGIPVAGARVETLDSEGECLSVVSVDVNSKSSDEDLKSRLGAFRAIAAAKAEGRLSIRYANVQIVSHEGWVDPLLIEIPWIDTTKRSLATESQKEFLAASVIPKVDALAADQPFTVSDISIGSERGVPVLAVDLILKEDGEDALMVFAERVWALARAAEPAIGTGCLRVFDESGKQIATEVQDFAIGMCLIDADIAYPK